MKVALTGPACSGKSTLLKELAHILSDRGYKIKIFDEIARDYIKESSQFDQHQLELKLFRLYLRRYSQMKDADIYLLDRDLIDVFCYTLLYDRRPDAIPLAEEIESAIHKYHADVYFLLLPLNKWEPAGRLPLEHSFEVREWEYLFWKHWLYSLFPRDIFIIDIDVSLTSPKDIANLIEIYYKILRAKHGKARTKSCQ